MTAIVVQRPYAQTAQPSLLAQTAMPKMATWHQPRVALRSDEAFTAGSGPHA